ncbi:hypothetical protein AYI69_g6964 [Smittium culicis]|uniref:Uncharacterized protein n=1 Tax=Smittium culicis TaxID=133412 RepID=A0A1R1XVJ0_9FUNG|nr:hypothetical protein AYI69_g6964 [Smittium culicis]
MASRNFAVANKILLAGVSEPWQIAVELSFNSSPRSLPTNLCEIEEGGRLLNCTLSMDVFSLIYGPVVFHRTAVQRPQSRSICSTVSGVFILQNGHSDLYAPSIMHALTMRCAVQYAPILILAMCSKLFCRSGYLSSKPIKLDWFPPFTFLIHCDIIDLSFFSAL